MKLTIFITILFLIISSCVDASKAKNKGKVVSTMASQIQTQFSDVPVMTIDELLELRKSDEKFVLVDVREAYEQKVSMIKGAITKEEFQKNKSHYQYKKVIAYCTIGYRSSEFVQSLKKSGIQAFNLKESLLGWAHKGQSFVSKGKETKRVHVYGDAWNLLPKGYQGVVD